MTDHQSPRTLDAPTFESLGVAPDLVAALRSSGIETPFPIQALTIADGLAGRDVCGKAKTGSGKTLAFGVPLLQRLAAGTSAGAPRGLVLVPTRELANQVASVLEPLAAAVGLRLVRCYGGTGMDAQIAALRSATDVLVATPGRLIDLRQRSAVDLSAVEILVLDEADRMADMGFLPQVEWLIRHLGPGPERPSERGAGPERPSERGTGPEQGAQSGGRQTMLFSATLDGDVDRLVRHELSDPVRHEAGADRPTVAAMEHRFLLVHHMDKVRVLAAICRRHDRVIAFTRTKRGADRLTDALRKEGVDARAIHGDLRQAVRERALRQFSTGRLPVLVATDVAARGIDVEDIDVVVHYDPPEDHKAYLHRSGRTARAGRSGLVVTLVLWNEQLEVERVQRRLGLAVPVVEMFSNDPRLADLRAWTPTSSPSRTAGAPASVA